MNAREIITSSLLSVTGFETVQLTFADRLEHGDYTTNVALRGNTNPREFAVEIVEKLQRNAELKKIVSKIEIAGPGFINFFLSEEYILSELSTALTEKDSYGSNDSQHGKNILVEYTDPNPFKELHIGHLYSNIVGESIAKLLESQGATVKRACYQGDVGLHVAKSLWGMKQKLKETALSELEKKSINDRVVFLGESYALGATAYEDNEKAKEEIIEINKQVFSNSSEIHDLYTKGRSWSLEYFDHMYARIGTQFDYFFFESEVSDEGASIVRSYLAKGVFEESNGAVIFPGEKYGLHSRVFINSLGLPTYEAKELALAPKKYETFPYDLSIVVTASEINEYFKVLLKALSLIRPDLAEKTLHIGHGFVRLPEGKMSSRTGNIIAAETVLNEAQTEALTLSKDKTHVAETIGQAAIKYAFLKNNIGGDIEFDLKTSVSFNGNSGPYLQYTVVRIQSLVSKGTKKIYTVETISEEDKNIARKVINFPSILNTAATKFQPSVIAEYLYDLASEFNTFYDSHRILGNERESEYVGVALVVATVLTNGLRILGIQVPEEM